MLLLLFRVLELYTLLVVFFSSFFVCIVETRMRANKQGGQETRGAGEGRTKQWETETGDLWKGEGLDGEHGVNKIWTPQGLSGPYETGNFQEGKQRI